MKINTEGLKLIKISESLRLHAYMCPAGIPTIGYGATRYRDGRPVLMGDRINEMEADQLLLDLVSGFEIEIHKAVIVPLNSNQFSALVSFVYNIGGEQFRKSTLLKHLNQGSYQLAAQEFPRWNKSRGEVLPGLTIRRKKEQELFNVPC